MQGYLSLVLHAHLPFVRHPEHEKFLEESWLFEAVTETYIPLIQLLENWRRDGIDARLTLSLSPTLCTMLGDPLLRTRSARHLNRLTDLDKRKFTGATSRCRPRASTRRIFSTNAPRKSRSSKGCWTARPSSSRRMTRNCSATGGMKGWNFWISSRGKCSTSAKTFRSSRPANI